MEQEFYRQRLKDLHGIEVVIPGAEEREAVHSVIYNELVLGIVKEESRKAFIKIIDQLVFRGAEGIILGCTEIPLLLQQDECKFKLYDTTAIHAEAAVDFALI